MANYNKVILLGNLTRDPQLSYTVNNTAVCDFGLAVNRRWRGPDGNQREETCYIDCRLYGRQAETFSQYMAKGRPVLVEGRLQFQQWQAQDGSRRSKHIVIVERFQFLGAPAGAAAPAGPEVVPNDGVQGAGPDFAAGEQPEGPPADDDIPF